MGEKSKNHPLRVLFLCEHWPVAGLTGGGVRGHYVAQTLKEIGEVHVATVGADPQNRQAIEKTKDEFKLDRCINFEADIPRTLAWRIRRSLDPKSLYPQGSAAELAGQIWLEDALQQFDLVWVFQLRVANLFRQWRWPKSVLDIDDVPSIYAQSAWRNSHGLKRLREALQILILRRREQLLPGRFNVLCVCSEADRQNLDLKARMHVIPNGCDRPVPEIPRQVTKPARIGFIGNFGHDPNHEGIQWFGRECWPRIKRLVPDCRLRLVGRGSDGPRKPAGADIDGLGLLPDPAAEMATWFLTIVPVRLGSGTRVKIPHAFSLRCPVVSTEYGAYGFEVQSGRELLLADQPEDFANACVSLIQDPARGAALADRAWKSFLEKWTWDAIRPSIRVAAEECLSVN